MLPKSPYHAYNDIKNTSLPHNATSQSHPLSFTLTFTPTSKPRYQLAPQALNRD